LSVQRYRVLPFKVLPCRSVLEVALDRLYWCLLLVADAVAEVGELVHVEPEAIERKQLMH